MAQDQIRYDILAQEALRGVMRKVLIEVAKTGLPGNHHFFITFLTQFPGVRISSRLREKYPEQMTIVLQHQYWDLEVTNSGFTVGLSFSDIPERLEIPFIAVRGFYDPSVNFELEFETSVDSAANDRADNLTALPASPAKLTDVTDAAEESATPEEASEKAEAPEAPKEEESAAAKGGDVVSLDAFRKKK